MVENNVWEMLQSLDLVILTHVHLMIVYTVIGQIGVNVLSLVVEDFKVELDNFSIQTFISNVQI